MNSFTVAFLAFYLRLNIFRGSHLSWLLLTPLFDTISFCTVYYKDERVKPKWFRTLTGGNFPRGSIVRIPTEIYLRKYHCMKSVRIRSFSGPYFRHSDWMPRDSSLYGIQSKCGKIWPRKSPNKDTFPAVYQRKLVGWRCT